MHDDDFQDALTCHADRLGVPFDIRIDSVTQTAFIRTPAGISLHVVTLSAEVWGVDISAEGTTINVLVSPQDNVSDWEAHARSCIHAVLSDSIVTEGSIANTAIF